MKRVQVCTLYKQAGFALLVTDPIHRATGESKRQKEQRERNQFKRTFSEELARATLPQDVHLADRCYSAASGDTVPA